jgi:membrane protein involved in colicin uptake
LASIKQGLQLKKVANQPIPKPKSMLNDIAKAMEERREVIEDEEDEEDIENEEDNDFGAAEDYKPKFGQSPKQKAEAEKKAAKEAEKKAATAKNATPSSGAGVDPMTAMMKNIENKKASMGQITNSKTDDSSDDADWE